MYVSRGDTYGFQSGPPRQRLSSPGVSVSERGVSSRGASPPAGDSLMSAQDQAQAPRAPAPSTQALGSPVSSLTKPWWRRGWGVTTIGVAGLLVGASVGIAAKAHTRTVTARYTTTTVRAAQAPVHTVTHTITHTETHIVTLTTPEPSHTIPSAPTTFSGGSGRKDIGTIVVPRLSAIHWHARGGHFELRSVPELGAVYDATEKGRSGKTAIVGGTYHLEVKAVGEWGFTLTPER
jgi:hypothetical protein